jgi:hypothetical protein
VGKHRVGRTVDVHVLENFLEVWDLEVPLSAQLHPTGVDEGGKGGDRGILLPRLVLGDEGSGDADTVRARSHAA